MNKVERKRMEDLRNVCLTMNMEEVNQNEWWCGTKGCLAGHYVKKYPRRELKIYEGGYTSFISNKKYVSDDTFLYLEDHFGISEDDATEIFQGSSNTGNDLRGELLGRIDYVMSKYPVKADLERKEV